jgi:hypothetical protein
VRSIGEEARTLRCAALVAESIQMELCPGGRFFGFSSSLNGIFPWDLCMVFRW